MKALEEGGGGGRSVDQMPSDTTLAALFARVNEDLLAQEGQPLTTDRVVQRAIEVVPAADGCGLTLRGRRGALDTASGTSEAVGRADQAQYDLGSGPCLESARGHGTLLSDDLDRDERWPRWSPIAVDLGFASVLSIRLRADGQDIGALNLYAAAADAFGQDDVDVAEVYASIAAAALSQARLVSGLRTAVDSRHQIGIAQGILVARYDLGVEQAFEVLRRLSNDHNVPVRQVAEKVVGARGLPGEVAG